MRPGRGQRSTPAAGETGDGGGRDEGVRRRVSCRRAGREGGRVESRWSKDKKEESQRRRGGTRGRERGGGRETSPVTGSPSLLVWGRGLCTVPSDCLGFLVGTLPTATPESHRPSHGAQGRNEGPAFQRGQRTTRQEVAQVEPAGNCLLVPGAPGKDSAQGRGLPPSSAGSWGAEASQCPYHGRQRQTETPFQVKEPTETSLPNVMPDPGLHLGMGEKSSNTGH